MKRRQARAKIQFWLVVLSAVVCGLYLARAPWQVYREQRTQANEAISDAQTNQMQRASLLKREAELKSPIGHEKLARERGYVKKGEVPLGSDTP